MTANASAQAMNFFERQDDAHRSTGRLVFIFIIAVILIILTTTCIAAFGVAIATGAEGPGFIGTITNPIFLVGISGITLAVIALGTLFKLAMLRGGGSAVAEQLGGTLIHPATTNTDERRVLNVVTEMAIASGVPAPPVYLLAQEEGINAFAAGYGLNDAAIGVTKGCMTHFTRDELQGVIAHEFSHILNGDMRLNIRLIGVIHGILVIGLLGQVMTRMWYVGAFGSSSRRKNDNSAAIIIAIILTGYLIMMVGFVGTFFGSLIKASVSRQREFLADASAVQFTRNPDGIGNALRRIGGHQHGATVRHVRATEVSHMFFGQAVTSNLASAFATHPPLKQRITRILPQWDGSWLTSRKERRLERASSTPKRSHRAPRPIPGAAGLAAGAASAPPSYRAAALDHAASHIGRPTREHVAYARSLINALPDGLRAAASEAWSAQAVVFALLLDQHDDDVRRRQIAVVLEQGDRPLANAMTSLWRDVARLDAVARMPLIDMTISSLRDMSETQYDRFKRIVVAMVGADEAIDLFEWTMHRLLLHQLAPHFEGVSGRSRTRPANSAMLSKHASLLLSLLAHAGHRDPANARRAFDRAALTSREIEVEFLPPERCGLRDADVALDALARLAPRRKETLINACMALVRHDDHVTVHEAELLRAIACSLGCPMPPLLADTTNGAPA